MIIEQVLIFTVVIITAVIISHYTENISKKLIKFLYSRFLKRGKKIDIIVDNSGIPIVDYKYIDRIYIGKQRNSITIILKALDYYKDYENGDKNSIQLFLNCSDWLVENAITRDDCAILEYNFPWPEYNMVSPWRSGMAQGQGLQVLIRAHKITSNEKYLNTAKKLLNLFFVEVKDGGVTYKTSNDGWWYEENACEYGKESRILNGMIFTILGIYEYYEYTKDENAKYLFEQGVLSLKKDISRYDMNGFSYYDILETPAWEYHNIHIELLESLYELTKEEIFKEYYEKWKNYSDLPFIIRLIKNPTKRSLTVLVFNFFILFLLAEIIFSLK
jgi:hypothetical protein